MRCGLWTYCYHAPTRVYARGRGHLGLVHRRFLIPQHRARPGEVHVAYTDKRMNRWLDKNATATKPSSLRKPVAGIGAFRPGLTSLALYLFSESHRKTRQDLFCSLIQHETVFLVCFSDVEHEQGGMNYLITVGSTKSDYVALSGTAPNGFSF